MDQISDQIPGDLDVLAAAHTESEDLLATVSINANGYERMQVVSQMHSVQHQGQNRLGGEIAAHHLADQVGSLALPQPANAAFGQPLELTLMQTLLIPC